MNKKETQMLRSLAREYFTEHSKDSGVVLIFEEEVAGWMSELRNPGNWEPGVFAVDIDGGIWKAVFGNSRDGALFWLQMAES